MCGWGAWQPMSGRIQELFKKYGRTAVAVHFTVYFSTLGACYAAVENKMDVEGTLVKFGLLRERGEGTEDDRQGWFSDMIAGKGSSFALAFLCSKALMPIRAGITVAATPSIHRFVLKLRGPAQHGLQGSSSSSSSSGPRPHGS